MVKDVNEVPVAEKEVPIFNRRWEKEEVDQEPKKAQKSEISGELSNLAEIVAVLGKQLDELEEKLETILSPPFDQVKEKTVEADAQTKLGLAIQDARRKARRNSNRLETILQRLDL